MIYGSILSYKMVEPTGVPHTRTISIQPRPRSPSQLIDMIPTVLDFVGRKWDLKNSKGDKITQIEFGQAVSQNPAFNLNFRSEAEFQSRTYLTMNCPKLGFAYVDDNYIVQITEVGKNVVKKQNLEELFLKQMLKWQYPSNQSDYLLKNNSSFHPFICALKICIELGKITKDKHQEYLSKEEVAMFLITLTSDNDVKKTCKEISKLRNETANLSSSQKKQKIYQRHIERLRKIYADDIKAGKFKVRGRQGTNTVEEFLEMKCGQHISDYGETIMRYMRFTGLFNASSRTRRLTLNPYQRWKVEMIVNDSTLLKPKLDIADKDKYFSWFGDPNIPKLPWENKQGYLNEIQENLHRVKEFLSNQQV